MGNITVEFDKNMKIENKHCSITAYNIHSIVITSKENLFNQYKSNSIIYMGNIDDSTLEYIYDYIKYRTNGELYSRVFCFKSTNIDDGYFSELIIRIEQLEAFETDIEFILKSDNPNKYIKYVVLGRYIFDHDESRLITSMMEKCFKDSGWWKYNG